MATGLVAVVAGFSIPIWGSISGRYLERAPLLIPAGFAHMLVALPILACAKCPSCGELFCGPQDEDTATPQTNVFVGHCKYCDFSP